MNEKNSITSGWIPLLLHFPTGPVLYFLLGFYLALSYKPTVFINSYKPTVLKCELIFIQSHLCKYIHSTQNYYHFQHNSNYSCTIILLEALYGEIDDWDINKKVSKHIFPPTATCLVSCRCCVCLCLSFAHSRLRKTRENNMGRTVSL